MTHHPSCPVRMYPFTPAVACHCEPRRRRTLAGDLARAIRTDAFALTLAGVAIAGLLLGLAWGWVR